MHQYKRRTSDEAQAIAQARFRTEVEAHSTRAEIEEFRLFAAVDSGSPTGNWEELIGMPVTDRFYYQFTLYKPSDVCPYIEKVYALILVSRDRSNEQCVIQWKAPLEPYTGPWFS